jgi:hypothetical protein
MTDQRLMAEAIAAGMPVGSFQPRRAEDRLGVEREIEDVFARYVRATDARDGAAQGALFSDDAITEILIRVGPGRYEPLGGQLVGGKGVQWAVENIMPPLADLSTSHHVTANHLIEVSGDRAHFNAQYVVFEVTGQWDPSAGLESVTARAGTVTPVGSGYYDSDLQLVGGDWKIVRHRVLSDLPIVVPVARS